jgi:hypothetical protein
MPVRRPSPISAALAAMVCSLLVAPSGARAATDDADALAPSSQALAALRDVRALFDGSTRVGRGLPLPGVPGSPAEPPAYAATLALRDLAVVKDQLRGDARAEAESYLARPTDPGGGQDDPYTVAEAPPACAGGVCVHYVASTNDAPALADDDANGRPDYIDTVLATTLLVRRTYLGAGYRAPKGDGTLGGGVDQSDIYVADIGDDGLYGYCPTDQRVRHRGPSDAWAYCVVDDDYSARQFPSNTPLENLQVTLAHEYFHAVQFAYDFLEDRWFMEATAAWVEDEVYDRVDDNLQYLRQSPLRLPRVPMDTYGGSFHYGTWIFFRYLTERYPTAQGGLPTIVRAMWRKADGARGGPDQYSIQAVKSVLSARGTDLPSLFAKFSAANRRPAQTYSEGRTNKYPAAPPVRRLRMGRGQSRGDTVSADHLTSATVRLTPAAGLRGRGARLRILVHMAPARRGSAAVATTKLRSGRVRVVPVRIHASGAGVRVLPFSPASVKYVELTLANAGTSYDCFSSGAYSCTGWSRDDDVKETFRATVLPGR